MTKNITTTMKKFGLLFSLAIAASTLMLSCVEHRPLRNSLRDETVYLDKSPLTQVDPNRENDDGWLYKVTVVKASAPNAAGDYAFTGMESDTQYIKFRFTEESLQILDGRALQIDDPNNPNDNHESLTDRVMMEFAGSNVDVKLHENLDTERTNLIEENTEEPWQKRQKFKIDLEKSSLDPITAIAWYYGEFLQQCARKVSATTVPGSFQWDADQQYLSWVIEVNYILTVDGGCYDMMNFAQNAGTASIQYRLSFHRPQPTDFVTQEIKEKDPINKKYGAFQIMNTFRDPQTEIFSAKKLLQRWNPNRAEPVVYYFNKGFPERFKPMFTQIKEQTNAILEKSGAKLRFDFRDYNDGGIERNVGDLRYSFIVWHQDIDTTRGLLGYGPSSVDPRTGEVISANVNLYNVGMDYYRFLIQDYLEENGATKAADLPATCKDGDTAASVSSSMKPYNTALFQEMRRTLELTGNTGTSDDFLPKAAMSKEDYQNYHNRLLTELRFAEPGYNPYVYRPSYMSAEQFKTHMAKEKEFQSAMSKLLNNENPFGTVPLYSREGIDKQYEFRKNIHAWKKNHYELEQDKDLLQGHRCIYTFDASDAIDAITRSARKCVGGKWETDQEYSDRIVEDVVYHVAIHEFGHTLSLRHNFYGSVDAKNMAADELSSSVMDYVKSQEEVSSSRKWGGYDEAALTWIFGNEQSRADVMKKDFLYCTDEHRGRSPLCTAHDLGITPSQIVLNAIERYDILYKIRNYRAYRTFWDTSAYVSGVYDAVFPMQRMWYLGLFNWGGGGIEETLKTLDSLQNSSAVKTDQQYFEIAKDFTNDTATAIKLMMAFYDAIINQPASSRNYQTEYDPYYGDILRLGIIIDKLFATYAFMDLQEVYNYDPNINTYVAMYDAPFSDQNKALAMRVLDNFLGANYDTFPWFKYTAVNIFASVTNSNLVDSLQLKERIAIKRFINQADLEKMFGPTIIAEATRADNPAQVFTYNGEEYVYSYLPDRMWHLVAGRSRNPVSYKFIRDYNRAMRADASDTKDIYGLKVLLAYHELYNNFSGY